MGLGFCRQHKFFNSWALVWLYLEEVRQFWHVSAGLAHFSPAGRDIHSCRVGLHLGKNLLHLNQRR